MKVAATHACEANGGRASCRLALGFCCALLCVTGCNIVSGAKFQAVQRELQLSQENVRSLEKQSADQQDQIERLQRQLAELRGLDAKTFDELIIPVRIQFARQSGAYDDDGELGDDGLLLYIQPIDADGHVVKAAGTIRIKLLDPSQAGDAMELGVYEFDRATTRSRWYGRLWTHHFSIKCPWKSDQMPTGNSVTAYVEFTDLLTGNVLTTQEAFDVQLRR